MNIEIDQSGKIENTNVPTIIAFSNHAAKTILINASDKRHLQQLFREVGRPKLFSYKLFAILIFILLKDHLSELQHIIIDTEYPGWDHLIKDFLLREIRRFRPHFDAKSISFMQIGKKSNAHLLSYSVHKKRQLPTIVVTAGDILKYIVK